MGEKQERNFNKMRMVEDAMEDKESGVMDCMMELLKTGTAFSSRTGRKKRDVKKASAQRRASLRMKSRGKLSSASRSVSGVMDVLTEEGEESGVVSTSGGSKDDNNRYLHVP